MARTPRDPVADATAHARKALAAAHKALAACAKAERAMLDTRVAYIRATADTTGPSGEQYRGMIHAEDQGREAVAAARALTHAAVVAARAEADAIDCAARTARIAAARTAA
jgi:hypothetical protein